MTEGELTGGNLTAVVRTGDAVRRTTEPHSPGVHALLRRLEAQRLDASRRFPRIDERGRDILSFIEGRGRFSELASRDVCKRASMWSLVG